ncbi:hypothetical protein [Pseudonocardia sp.]|uniref:hypothetical protein n=1 Tax=Pseudonocardia sp. TaxID=60912 RepID=UPI002633F3F4|nr:hypothetical protein [Pseudonocardia sp.]
MSRTNSGFENNDRHEQTDGSPAVRRAEAGTAAWRAALEAHQNAGTVDHQDIYGLTRELVATLGPISSLMRLVSTQVAGYADSLPDGQAVYDDERAVDPRELLAQAAEVLDLLSSKTCAVTLELNTFWSLIGRIGVETARAAPDSEASR